MNLWSKIRFSAFEVELARDSDNTFNLSTCNIQNLQLSIKKKNYESNGENFPYYQYSVKFEIKLLTIYLKPLAEYSDFYFLNMPKCKKIRVLDMDESFRRVRYALWMHDVGDMSRKE